MLTKAAQKQFITSTVEEMNEKISGCKKSISEIEYRIATYANTDKFWFDAKDGYSESLIWMQRELKRHQEGAQFKVKINTTKGCSYWTYSGSTSSFDEAATFTMANMPSLFKQSLKHKRAELIYL